MRTVDVVSTWEPNVSIAEFIYTTVLAPPPLRAAANFALKSIARRTIRIGSAIVVLNPDDPVISGALTLGIYEQNEIAFMHAVCRDGMTIIDIGANVGLFTALCGSLSAPRGQVVAIEPDPTNRAFLERTVAANPRFADRVRILAAAAGTEPGKASLYLSRANLGDHRLYPHEFSTSSVDVDVVRLDDCLRELAIKTIDLVKIDVQGFELHALKGLEETINASPRVTILSEFWPKGLRAAGADAASYLSWLRRLGFTVSKLERRGATSLITDDQALIASLPGRKYATIVAVKA